MKVIFSKVKYLILTGYKGYVGSSVTLSDICNDWVEVELSELENEQAPLTLVHLASIANKNNDDINTYIENVALDLAVIKFICNSAHRLVFISGNNVYPKMTNAKISDADGGEDFYSKSKFSTENILRHIPKDKYIILRLADVFGCNQRHGAFFKSLEKSIELSKPISKFGNGYKLRSYIYIEELVLLIFHISNVQRFNGEIFNISHPKSLYISEIIDVISLNANLDILNVPYESNEKHDIRTMNNANVFNYKYTYTIETALNDFCDKVRDKK